MASSSGGGQLRRRTDRGHGATGQRRTYRITELAIVEPTDIWPLGPTDEPAVTLVTCYPFYFSGSAPQRFIVRAVAVD